MKIICIGRNYAKHAKELKNEIPTEPIIFMKPESALSSSSIFSLPEFSNNVHYELEIVVRIDKKGKNILENEASNYYSELALGIDFTARDLQSQLKVKGLPWEKAKGFDQSAFISTFFDKQRLTNETFFSMNKNGKQVQLGQSKNMLFSIDQLIENCSIFFTLEEGDLIYTGTPEGVGQIVKNDVLEGFIEDVKLFDVKMV